MKTKVMVFKDKNDKWVLRITVYDQNGKDIVTRFERDKLYQVIEIACLLKLEINNETELPLKCLKRCV